MLIIEEIENGFRITHPGNRWTWWVYPDSLEICNNGERYKLKGERTAPFLTLPPNWTLGNVVDSILKHTARSN